MATLKKLAALTKKLAALTTNDLVDGNIFYDEYLKIAKACIAYECDCNEEDITDEEAEESEDFEELHNTFVKELSEEIEETLTEIIESLSESENETDAIMHLNQVLRHAGVGRLFTTSEYLTFFELDQKLDPIKNGLSTICYIWG